MKKLFILLFSLFLLGGCAVTPQQQMAAQAYMDNQARINSINFVSKTYDPYSKRTEYKGKILFIRGNGLIFIQSLACKMFLRAYKYEDSTVIYQLYIIEKYRNKSWQFYNRASDINGQHLSFTSIDKEVSSCSSHGCWFKEDMVINLTKEYLVDHITTGINFKIYGKNWDKTYILQGAYINNFLEKVEPTTKFLTAPK